MRHPLRSGGFSDAPDLFIGSFYDPALDEGCAFEQLISVHGGLDGPQTWLLLLHPARLPAVKRPVIGAGAEELHRCSPASHGSSRAARNRRRSRQRPRSP